MRLVFSTQEAFAGGFQAYNVGWVFLPDVGPDVDRYLAVVQFDEHRPSESISTGMVTVARKSHCNSVRLSPQQTGMPTFFIHSII